MSTKCIVVGGTGIKISDPEIWKDFERRLNNPRQETKSARNKFFEECEKLFITEDNDIITVETEKLSNAEILNVLQGRC